MWDLGYFIAQPLGAWLYNTGGFVLNFGSAVCIYSLACFIGVVRLWGVKEKINKCDLTIKGKLIYNPPPPQKSIPEGRRPTRATALRSNASPLGQS